MTRYTSLCYRNDVIFCETPRFSVEKKICAVAHLVSEFKIRGTPRLSVEITISSVEHLVCESKLRGKIFCASNLQYNIAQIHISFYNTFIYI